jgi:hypothetical protein
MNAQNAPSERKRMSPILLSSNDFITTWGLTYVGDNDEKIKGEKKRRQKPGGWTTFPLNFIVHCVKVTRISNSIR